MFTGIIHQVGIVKELISQQENKLIVIESELSSMLKIDQSLSHNGVCLTVVHVHGDLHQVVAVPETLSKSNIQYWTAGTKVNLERSLQLSSLLDGHIVQGHVDTTAVCIDKQEGANHWNFRFQVEERFAPLFIEKGSIAVNGISLTCFHCTHNTFEVAIIPYTYHHTNMHTLHVGSIVNIEFDMIGKYLNRRMDFLKS
jgi:riboflavin synthase, alpha subunit